MSAISCASKGSTLFYGASQILFGVGSRLPEGRTMALLGRNGAGKSTTMKAIAGLPAGAQRPGPLRRPRHDRARRRIAARGSASPTCRRTGRCSPSTACRTIC